MKFDSKNDEIILTPTDAMDCYNLGLLAGKTDHHAEFTKASDTPYSMRFMKIKIKDIFELIINNATKIKGKYE